MKTLYLAWQDTGKTRGWYPIGQLDADSARGPFQFRYLQGAARAEKEAGLRPLPSFPDFGKRYESESLFPLFRNRLLSEDREDFEEYMRYLDLAPETADPLEILAISEGRRQTDTFEVFPKIVRNSAGGFACRFFLHGWRHVTPEARERIITLGQDEELRVAIEMNNPATRLALQLQTSDYHMIGWTPRYLVFDLVQAISNEYRDIHVRVVKVNPAPAPSQQRVLVEMKGSYPEDVEPMSSEDYQPLPLSA